MRKFAIIKKSAGYVVKSFNDEEVARDYAEKCCKANHNRDFFVAVYRGGMFHEI